MNESEESGASAPLGAFIARQWWVIALATVLTMAAAYALSTLQTKEYVSSSLLLFRESALEAQITGSPAPGGDDEEERALTNVALVDTREVAERTSRALGGNPSPSEIDEQVTVSRAEKTTLVRITANQPDPDDSARLANTFAEQYVNLRGSQEASRVREARRTVQAQLRNLTASERRTGQAQQLAERAVRLSVLEKLRTQSVQLVERAVPPSEPEAPRPRRNAALGALLGLLLGVGLAVVREQSDRRLRSPREIGRALGLPILGVIPGRRIGLPGRDGTGLRPGQVEAYRMLQANLRYFEGGRSLASVAVCSALPGEGKTTTAYNLAAAVAAAGSRVVLVEADMRRPVMARRYGARATPGLGELLSGERTSGVVQRVSAPGLNGGGASFDLVVAGEPRPNAAELAQSERLRWLIKEMERRYDLVVVDTPAMATYSDAIPLVKWVHGVLLVTNIGLSTRSQTAELHDRLRHLNAPVLGVVAMGGDAQEGYQVGSRAE